MTKGNKCPHKKPTLCFSCIRLDCSWMRYLEPVAGWDAKKTVIKNTVIKNKIKGKDASMPSYCVESCPGYVPAKK